MLRQCPSPSPIGGNGAESREPADGGTPLLGMLVPGFSWRKLIVSQEIYPPQRAKPAQFLARPPVVVREAIPQFIRHRNCTFFHRVAFPRFRKDPIMSTMTEKMSEAGTGLAPTKQQQ